jgi:hypothetical protein
MLTRTILLAVLALACCLLSTAHGQDETKTPPLNDKVLAYAVAQKGKQVGNGECWTLADEALASAGARRPGQGGYAVYEFGRALKTDEKVLPGDIVQFNDAKFVTRTATKEFTLLMPLHTGVVSKVDGTKIEMINQNLSGVRGVAVTTFDRADLKEGKMQFFRPQAAK